MIKKLKEKLLKKVEKSGKFDWVPYVLNNSKEFAEFKDFIYSEMAKKNIKTIMEFVYLMINDIEMPLICPYCGERNRIFHRVTTGYHNSCGHKECMFKQQSKNAKSWIRSPETCALISKINKGKKLSIEHKEKISKARMGKFLWTDERKKSVSDSLKLKGKEFIARVGDKGIIAATSTESKEKRKNTLLKKYGVSNAGRMAKRCPYSKASQRLFNEIKNTLNLDDCFFAECNGEKQIGNFRVDFIYKNTIIEFNGDIYHGNPELFEANDKPNPFKELTCSELWEEDRKRKEILENQGYNIIVVWEMEFKKNKKETISRLCNIIKDKYKLDDNKVTSNAN